ncbi:unnamed protein product [Gongylonema pulchrum]|uniref:RT_RNaseH domain-containing protein n=1 Tax=Gongylonema pulchrum TaxID=637853 RepID=A0A183DQM5_9BILA|nr:unnamed protein product [Gongylonema pulchrum]
MFRPYIMMSKSVVHSDHKPLSYILKKASAHPNLARWVIELQNYNVTVEFIKGEQNRAADALSRVDEDTAPNLSPDMEDIEFPRCLLMEVKFHPICGVTASNQLHLRKPNDDRYLIDITEEQNKDVELSLFIQFLRYGILPILESPSPLQKFIQTVKSYFIDDTGCLRFRRPIPTNNHSTSHIHIRHSTPLVIPAALRSLVFAWHNAHEYSKVAQARMKTQYDRHAFESTVAVGDGVLLLRTAHKLGYFTQVCLTMNRRISSHRS